VNHVLTKLASAENDDVVRLGASEHLTASLSRDPRASKHAQILVHVERFTTDPIRLKDPRAKVVDEAQRRDDQGRSARKLGTAVRGGVVSVKGWMC
jgi:type II secretory pathway predicted ATPase ExeA